MICFPCQRIRNGALFLLASIPAHSRSIVPGQEHFPWGRGAARGGSCVELLPVETMLQEAGSSCRSAQLHFPCSRFISRGKLTNCSRHLFPVPLTFCPRLPPSMRDCAQEFAVTHTHTGCSESFCFFFFFTRGWTLPYKRCPQQPGLPKTPGFLRGSLGPQPRDAFP